MLPYWIMFTVWAAGTIQAGRDRTPLLHLSFLVAAVLTTLMIGLRFQVGADWYNYLSTYNRIEFLDFRDAVVFTDPGYAFLNWIAAQLDFGIVFANLICAIVFGSGYFYFCYKQPAPWLAVLVTYPYLILVVAMGYTRQGAAIGLIYFAISRYSEKDILRITIFILFATLFHKTAILLLPIILLPVAIRNSLWAMIGVGMFFPIFFIFLGSSADQLVSFYVNGTLDSQGAWIRISMNVLAAILFLIFYKRIDIPRFQKIYWTACSILALLSVLALSLASASTGVDRFSVYLIPLQATVYSRLPSLLSKDNRPLPSIKILLLLYSFSLQFVWFNYATYAKAWLPYQSILF